MIDVIAHRLLRNPPGKGSRSMTDRWLGVFCQERDVPFVYHVPSVVSHVGEASTFARRGRKPIVRPLNEHRREGIWVPDLTNWPDSPRVESTDRLESPSSAP